MAPHRRFTFRLHYLAFLLRFGRIMIRGGRTVDHKTSGGWRLSGVWEGEDPGIVIASYGFCRTTIYKWLRQAKARGRGLRALRSRKGSARPPKPAAKQARQVFRWINGKDPRQYGFDFGLWTRQVVAELVADNFGIRLSLASVVGCWPHGG
jgi:transposase